MHFAQPSAPPHLLNLPRSHKESSFKRYSHFRTPPPGSLSSILQSLEKSSHLQLISQPAGASLISPKQRGTLDSEDFLDILDNFVIGQNAESPSEKISAPYYRSTQTEFRYSSPPWLSHPIRSNNYQEKAPVFPILLDSRNHYILEMLISEMTAEADRVAATAFKNGYQKAMTTLLERCMFSRYLRFLIVL